jgi:hypothetical protein
LPRRHCCPTVLIKTERQDKKNGEKALRFDDFSVLLIIFFQLNCYFWVEPVISDISVHRLVFAPPLLPPDRVDYNSAAMQKER